jgi:hypothetical protein
MSQIQWMKKAIILAVPLDVSIQVTGMPNPERSALSAGTLKINFTYHGPTCP